MTATLNGMFSSAPDTPSPIYPDRLIRPLPKRPLRSRLSSDAADTILFPPAPPATQLFYGACADRGEAVNDAKVYVQQSDSRDHSPEQDHHLSYENGVDVESGDEDGPVVVRRSAGFRGSPLSPSVANAQPQVHPGHEEGPPVKPATAGPDGYDAFENTNNKKKRKIPTPGNLGGHSTLSPEFSNMGLASSIPHSVQTTVPGDGNHVSTFYGTGSPASPVGSGLSGPGRGRLGRQTPRNSVGRASFSHHSPVSWSQGRLPARRDGLLSSPGPSGDSPGKPGQGIISAAIAKAASSAFSSPPGGPRSGSALDQQATTPTKTQFTFTCESDSSKGMALQAQKAIAAQRSPGSVPASQSQRGPSAQGTQTSPNVASQGHGQSAPTPETEAPPARQKKKRSRESLYALAARQRKIQQQYANLHHPSSLEDVWICEFCEYESIFGHPPAALIRSYEKKDRQERKRLAEKKRLLEKAKMKGRKNRKATKGAAKHGHQGAGDAGCDRASADHSSMGGAGHDDDDPGHEYEDEAAPGPPPAPPPASKTSQPLDHHGKPAGAPGAKGTQDGGTNRPP